VTVSESDARGWIDLSQAKPQKLTEQSKGVEMLITMGCGDECPNIPDLIRDDWALPDPKGHEIKAVRLTRDEIKLLVESLLERIQLT
jgi:protein-tyrosine-phosphatase